MKGMGLEISFHLVRWGHLLLCVDLELVDGKSKVISDPILSF